MAYFMINYDLEKSKDYQKLITELEPLRRRFPHGLLNWTIRHRRCEIT